jgi:DNA-binding XRE family transcriptional regulator
MSIDIKPVAENDEIVTLEKADYDALLDALEDAEARAALRQSEGQESFPKEIADALINGGHPVRVFRQYRKLTLTALAKAAGVSISYLSEIEKGHKPGSAAALSAVAKILKVEVEDLI